MTTSNNTGNGSKLKAIGACTGFFGIVGAFMVHRLFIELMIAAGIGVVLMCVGIFIEDK